MYEKCRDQRWARAGVPERSSEEPRGVSWAEGNKGGFRPRMHSPGLSPGSAFGTWATKM